MSLSPFLSVDLELGTGSRRKESSAMNSYLWEHGTTFGSI
jgi:hypothetical protein